MSADAQRSEAVRACLLQFLAERPSLSFDADALLARLNRLQQLDFKAEKQDIVDALAFLVSGEHVSARPHPHGSTLFYQVTRAGVLAHERGTLTP